MLVKGLGFSRIYRNMDVVMGRETGVFAPLNITGPINAFSIEDKKNGLD